MLRIILLKGQSQYGSLRLHIDQLAKSFTDLGHEAIVIDLTAPTALPTLQAAVSRPVHFFYAFNSMGADLASAAGSLYEQLDTLYLTLHVDHPIHLWDRLELKLGRRRAVSFLDRTHVELVRDAFPDGHFGALSFMPPGANTSLPPVTPEEDALFAPGWAARRDIPLLFTGTYRGAPQRPWRAAGENFVTKVFDAAADIALAHDTLSLEQAFDKAVAAHDVTLSPKLRTSLISKAQEVYQFVEAQRRHSLLSTLNAAGIPVVVYGKGWQDSPFAAFDWRGEGSFEETLALLRRTRLVLNSNNNFVAGGHERVFAAQINGAAVISDTSLFYEQAFTPGQDILLYRWTALDAVPEQIRQALADPVGLESVARAGFRRTRAENGWDARARHIIDLFGATQILSRGV